VTLNEFVKEQHALLERFRVRWKEANQAQGSEFYPMEMEKGDWDEQFWVLDSWRHFQDEAP